MTHRERLEAKLAKREEWADKAEARAEQRFDIVHNIADNIPLGQPILIGHHSEARARRDADRIDTNMRKGIEETNLAKHHAAAADGIARQLDRSIFSDDANAIDALQARIAIREEQAARMVEMNKAWRKAKGNAATFANLADIEPNHALAIARRIEGAYSWEKQPHPTWELSNLRATINRDKKRIEEIQQRHTRADKAAAGGVTVEDLNHGYCRVTFAEKPAREILTALKVAGFYWQRGSWQGKTDALPDGIR